MPDSFHLYIHIPFCTHKCHYCDFNSHVRDEHPWAEYFSALKKELNTWAGHPSFQQRPISTIFIGGGTPSLAPPKYIQTLLNFIFDRFPCDSSMEISLEANPGSSEADHFSALHQAGVNRLSIGVQSLRNSDLKWLERIHRSDEAIEALTKARKAGFSNINIDLMYGLPEQTLSEWEDILVQAMELSTPHMSCYQLTVEPHTRLASSHARQPYALPDNDTSAAFLDKTRNLLEKEGYTAYEVSNYAKADHICQHNDAYWKYCDYLGVGAGAAGKMDTDDGGILRYTNVRSPERYIGLIQEKGHAMHIEDRLDHHKARQEAVWLGLRRAKGISIDAFSKRFGNKATPWLNKVLSPWCKENMVENAENHWRLTTKGLMVADTIAESVLLS